MNGEYIYVRAVPGMTQLDPGRAHVPGDANPKKMLSILAAGSSLLLLSFS